MNNNKIYENENFKVEFFGKAFDITDKKSGYKDCGLVTDNGSLVGRTQKAYRLAIKARKELHF